jgi:hypothetical protein
MGLGSIVQNLRYQRHNQQALKLARALHSKRYYNLFFFASPRQDIWLLDAFAKRLHPTFQQLYQVSTFSSDASKIQPSLRELEALSTSIDITSHIRIHLSTDFVLVV